MSTAGCLQPQKTSIRDLKGIHPKADIHPIQGLIFYLEAPHNVKSPSQGQRCGDWPSPRFQGYESQPP